MSATHVYQLYIRADIETVWNALLDPAFTTRFFHRTRFAEPPAEGAPYVSVLPDGSPAVDGVIEVLDPPHRLVQTWHVRYAPELEAEAPGRVEWTLQRAGAGLTLLRLVHGDLAFSPRTWESVKDGWVWVLDALKTLLETGDPLPAVTGTTHALSADEVRGSWHRNQAAAANNETYRLLQAQAMDAQAALRAAYAAAYHWDRAAGRLPENAARADYLIGKAWLAAMNPALAFDYGDRVLAACQRHGLADFDLAYAHELRARALRALGRVEEARSEWAAALAVPIADPEDAKIVAADFADWEECN